MQPTTNSNASWLSSLFTSGSQGANTATTANTVTQKTNNYASLAQGSSSLLGSLNTAVQGIQQAKNSRLNADFLDQQANTVALQTGSQVSQIRQQGKHTLAQQSAGFADNGTGSGGTNALLQRSTAIDTEMDAATANYNGQQQITNIKNQSNALRAQAKLQQPGLISLLSGVSNTASAYYGTKSLLKG